jgi:release factor glutamine methyltransferase
MTFAQALAAAAALGLTRLDAQLLLLHTLGRGQHERAWLLAHDTDLLPEPQSARFFELCKCRAAGEPLAYLVGAKEFFGLPLQVDRRVLVPRPDTETLVEWALEVLGEMAVNEASPSVIDLGTGSGAIALAIKKDCPQAHVTATDRSADALEVASENARSLTLDIQLRQAHWLAGIDERFDLIVSNPPYVAENDPHLAALAYEPLSALASGPDGLADIRSIVAQAPSRLRSGGWLLLEHGWDQPAAVRELLAAAGFSHAQSRRDLAGIERCSGGQWLELG